jgi:NAD(P)-dependent dehydrogenase (short-subunit alcohol dehydrogenase family)
MATNDLNAIPLDAPVTAKKPSWLWLQLQNVKGMSHKKVYPKPVDLTGKWAMISGGNNGIGRRAALVFAEWGANVVLATRDPPPHETHPTKAVEECKQAAKEAGHTESIIEWWEVDYSKLSSVETLAAKWLETGRPIDILCNNAGLGMNPGKDKFIYTEDGYELMHQVNLLAHVLLTMHLIPAIAKAEQPRIVNTTSAFHYFGEFDLTNFNGEKSRKPGEKAGLAMDVYKNNKLWMQIWLAELQRRCLQHDQLRHITVNGCHPGYVNTGIAQVTFDKAGVFVRKVVMPLMLKMAPLLSIDDYQGAMALVFTSTTPEAGPDPKVQGVGAPSGKGGGKYFNRVWDIPPQPLSLDPDCRLRVWKKLNNELKLQEKGLLDILGVDYFEATLVNTISEKLHSN